MMMANPEVYVVSPNRNVPTRTWNPIEVIENFIATGSNPSWIVLNVIPVIPPGL